MVQKRLFLTYRITLPRRHISCLELSEVSANIKRFSSVNPVPTVLMEEHGFLRKGLERINLCTHMRGVMWFGVKIISKEAAPTSATEVEQKLV